MKAGWTNKPIGDVFKVVNGGTPKTGVASNWDGSHAWITPAEMGNLDTPYISESRRALTDEGLRTGAELVPAGSIILSSRAPIGHLVINEIPMAFNQGCKGLIPKSGIDTKFAYYFMLTNVPLFESLGTGTTFKELSSGKLKEVPFQFPELREQRRIVTLLDEAFADIATAKANAEKNLQNARELFSNQLSLALIPSGPDWVETNVGETCTLKSGTTVPTSIERPDGEIPYVKVAEMSMPENAEGICTSIRFLDRSDVKNGWLIPAGAVIFPKRGGAILTNKKRLVLREMCADLNIMSVIPSEMLTPEFLYFYFLNVDMRVLGTGSSIPQINNYDIAPLKISFPKSKEKQVELTEMLRSIEAECNSLDAIYRQKLTALDDLKKSLLHQAFSGQL